MEIVVLQKNDSEANKSRYHNKVKSLNNASLQNVMNGMKSFEDINFLKVKGVSKLAKEIAETHQIEQKLIDKVALHRNEKTNEYEGTV